jgi:pimeloyl-ACP methyl ester carboxylesterase
MRLLRNEHLVVAPDFHGYGSSPPLPRDNRPYFIHDSAIVKAIVEQLEQPVHLVGHSLGGTVALRTALDIPDKVRSLTVIEPVLFNLLEETGAAERHEYREVAHDMLILDYYGAREASARLFMDFWIGKGEFDALDSDTREYIIRTIGRVADDWRGISQHAPGQCRLEDLETLKMPVLIICADQTRSSTRAIVELFTGRVEHAEHRRVAGAAHLSPITDPEKVNPLIQSFLSRQTDEI